MSFNGFLSDMKQIHVNGSCEWKKKHQVKLCLCSHKEKCNGEFRRNFQQCASSSFLKMKQKWLALYHFVVQLKRQT